MQSIPQRLLLEGLFQRIIKLKIKLSGIKIIQRVKKINPIRRNSRMEYNGFLFHDLTDFILFPLVSDL